MCHVVARAWYTLYGPDAGRGDVTTVRRVPVSCSVWLDTTDWAETKAAPSYVALAWACTRVGCRLRRRQCMHRYVAAKKQHGGHALNGLVRQQRKCQRHIQRIVDAI